MLSHIGSHHHPHIRDGRSSIPRKGINCSILLPSQRRETKVDEIQLIRLGGKMK